LCHIELSKTHVQIHTYVYITSEIKSATTFPHLGRTIGVVEATPNMFRIDSVVCLHRLRQPPECLQRHLGFRRMGLAPSKSTMVRVGGSGASDGRDCTRRPRSTHCDKRDEQLMLCCRSRKSPRDGGRMATSDGTSIDCCPKSMEVYVWYQQHHAGGQDTDQAFKKYRTTINLCTTPFCS
jgi:hypothetical protein